MRMGARTKVTGFWLPSEFLTDDDFLMDKENFNTANFPSEFPYGFDTRTDHLLKKLCAMSTSRSRSGAPSMGPKYEGVGDLIFLAAGQVSELKLNRGYAVHPSLLQRNLAQHTHSVTAKIPSRSAYVTQYVGGRSSRVVPTPGRFGLFSGGAAAAKKTCAGTGVFLPRQYDNISHTNTYLSGPPGCSPSQVRASTKCYYDSTYPFVESQLQPQSRIVSDRNSILAPRHAETLVPEVSSMIGRGLPCLPGEWTY